MPTFTTLGHVALRVKDIDKTMNFYNEILDLPEMLRLHHPDGSLFLIYLRVTDTQYIELFPNAATPQAPHFTHNGINHFCLTVENIDDTMAEIMARGGKPCRWVDTDDGGRALIETETPFIGLGLDGNRQCWMRDPDGNRIELMEMAKDCMQYEGIRRLRGDKATV